jgi:hypothetical protein
MASFLCNNLFACKCFSECEHRRNHFNLITSFETNYEYLQRRNKELESKTTVMSLVAVAGIIKIQALWRGYIFKKALPYALAQVGNEMKIYPPFICGPLLRQVRGEYNEDEMEDITINSKHYKIDTYGNVSGYKGCLFGYDSSGHLEEMGIWENNNITKYTFGYSYY